MLQYAVMVALTLTSFNAAITNSSRLPLKVVLFTLYSLLFTLYSLLHDLAETIRISHSSSDLFNMAIAAKREKQPGRVSGNEHAVPD